MQEIRDGFHEILRNLHRLTISSSGLLKIAEKEKYKVMHEKDHMEKALEALEKSCELAKVAAREVESLREKVYNQLNMET